MKRTRSSRRDFLKGRSVLDALRDCLQPSGEPVPKPGSASVDSEGQKLRETHYLENYSKNAMACEFEMLFNLHQHPAAGEMSLKSFSLVDDLESQLSIYQPESELTLLNQTAHEHPRQVESRLFELLELSLRINRETGGAFDITASPLSRLWGFDARQGILPTQSEIDETISCVGSHFLELDPAQSQLFIGHPDTNIDLGGIGKGYALDRVAELMNDSEVADWILHGGQSSVIARGHCSTTDAENEGWRVGVTHPAVPGLRLGEVVLRDRALGTSGTARQGFFADGIRYGHIIDPRSGWPTQHCLSTTVISDSAALSDALATAFFVMEAAEVETYCRENLDVAAVLVIPGNSAGNTELVWFNLDEGEWIRH